MKVYEDFNPVLKALISKVDPSTLKVWQLMDMEKLETWTTGKLVLLGDAAHPFTPRKSRNMKPRDSATASNTNIAQIRDKVLARPSKTLRR
jgi:hypothetical protein